MKKLGKHNEGKQCVYMNIIPAGCRTKNTIINGFKKKKKVKLLKLRLVKAADDSCWFVYRDKVILESVQISITAQKSKFVFILNGTPSNSRSFSFKMFFHHDAVKPNEPFIQTEALTPSWWIAAVSSTVLLDLCSSPAPPPRTGSMRSPSPAPPLSCPGTDIEI